MKKNSGVHLLYKNIGETPNEVILRFKKENPEYSDVVMTYAGRLDPMAEGLLLVLSGEEIKKKDEYLGLPKIYEFEILWGFETDTLDLLGRVGVSSQHLVSRKDLKKELKKFVGKFEQKYPAYSSKPVDSKPLFQWAREGKLNEIEIPSHEVEVHSVDFVSRREIVKDDLLRYIVRNINSVSGDFRQEEIIKQWQELMSKSLFDIFLIDKISITVSSGFYVRQFVSDLAESLGVKATTFHIKRVKVGEYSTEDCA
ncbi:MAG TPA: hypothetical protein VJG67_00865 [Candidatus Paceibacterota bacterium]